jgi:DNA invertase Pin-like site-specific DNA recombinase
MARIGYIRVSSEEQNPARQRELMERIGVDKLFEDKLSGKDTDRPGFADMLNYVREGDTVIVESISRLSRSLRDFFATMDVFKDRGVHFESLKENIITNTPQGKLVMTMFVALAEFEREVIRERQAEGIAIAKREGKYKGRKPVEVNDAELRAEFEKFRRGEITAREAMRTLGLKPSTFWRRVREARDE